MNLSFIKLDINIMNDTKVKLIRKMPDGSKLFELWIGILCLGMKSGRAGTLEIGDGIPFTDETLSLTLDIPLQTVRLGLLTFQNFKMIETFENESIYICNFEKHQELSKIKIHNEKNRKKVAKYRKKQKLLALKVDENVTVTTPNVTVQTKTKTQTKIQTKKETITVRTKVLDPYEVEADLIFSSLKRFREQQGTYKTMSKGQAIGFNKGKKELARLVKIDGADTIRDVFNFGVKDKFWKSVSLTVGHYSSIKSQYLDKKEKPSEDLADEILQEMEG